MNRPKLTIHRGWPKPARPDPVPRVSPPVALPPPSTVCEPCGTYVIYPDRHAAWHRREDAKWSRWEAFRRLVLDVFQARGYITTAEKAAASDGDTE